MSFIANPYRTTSTRMRRLSGIANAFPSLWDRPASGRTPAPRTRRVPGAATSTRGR